MTSTVTLGIDIGASSTKGVLVDDAGQILTTVSRGLLAKAAFFAEPGSRCICAVIL